MKPIKNLFELPESKKSTIKILLFLLFSFLFHFIVLILFFDLSVRQQLASLKNFLQKKSEQKSVPKQEELKVFFQEQPKPTIKQHAADLKQKESGLPATLKKIKSTFGTHMHAQTATQNLEQIPEKLPEDHDPFDSSDKEDAIQAPEIQKEVSTLLAPTINTKEDSKKNVTAIKSQEQTSSFVKNQEGTSFVAEEKKITSSETGEQSVVNKNNQKKKKNILAMTKGFIDTFKEGSENGNNFLYDRKGDDNKQPTFEELQFISYDQKIYWQMQSAWNRNFLRKAKPGHIGKTTTISYAIDEKGNLAEINLVKSSGDNELDTMLMETVRLAAPYPPLPKHFNMKMYSRTGPFTIVRSATLF